MFVSPNCRPSRRVAALAEVRRQRLRWPGEVRCRRGWCRRTRRRARGRARGARGRRRSSATPSSRDLARRRRSTSTARGIPHFLQPHAFLPRGRRVLTRARAGRARRAARGRRRAAGPRRPTARRRASPATRTSSTSGCAGRSSSGRCAAPRPRSRGSSCVRRRGSRDLPRGRARRRRHRRRARGTARPCAATSSSTRSAATAARPAGRARPAEPTDCGAVYYCRYFELADGVEHLDAGREPAQPARRPRLHGLQHLPRRQPHVSR